MITLPWRAFRLSVTHRTKSARPPDTGTLAEAADGRAPHGWAKRPAWGMTVGKLKRRLLQLWAPVCVMSLMVPSDVVSQIIPEPVEGVTILSEDRRHCTDCITLNRELVLDSADEELGGLGPGPLFRDSRGRLFHWNGFVRSVLLVFDPRGHYEGAIGRAGAGPGEFSDARHVFIGRNDTLRVYDRAMGRMTTLSPELDFVQSDALGIRVEDAVAMLPGFMIVNATVRTPERFGYPLHRVRDGALGPPMGGTEALADSPRIEAYEVDRKLARVSDSTFWAVHVPEYRLELWRTDDTLLRVLTGDPEWFDVVDRSTLKGRLNPTVRDVALDEEGRLWLLTNVRATDWEEWAYDAGNSPVRGLPNIQSRTGEHSDLTNSVIQVIDPQSGVVIATARFDYPFLSFAGPGRVYTYEEPMPDRPQPRVVVWQLQFPQNLPPSREQDQ